MKALLLVSAMFGCASTPESTAPPAPNGLGAMAGERAPWPWRHGQALRVQISARGGRNVGALTQRWNMSLEERWQVSIESSTRMAIAIETIGDWKGDLAAPDGSAGSGYYLGFVTGLVMDEWGKVVSVQGGSAAREKARQKVEALRKMDHTAGAELDRSLDDELLARGFTRVLRRVAELRTTRQDRGFTEPTTFAISGAHPVPVAYKLTRTPAPCQPDGPPCLRIELSGQADPGALRAGAPTALEDVSRGTQAWLLLTERRREVVEVGDRVFGREVWKTGAGSTDAGLDDGIVIRFD